MATGIFQVIARMWIEIRHGRGHLIDNITGMTDKEKKLIVDSKAVLLAEPLKTGITILLKFFEKFPHHLKIYLFKDLSLEELKSDKAFLEQSTKLMSAIEIWINKLYNPEELKNIIAQTGVEDNLPKQYYLDFQEAFIDYLIPLVDKKTLQAWKKFMAFATKTIISSLK
ncbi:cytoglobin-2-like [Harmonia axyridis]|uniref:cytoglobin-2-like n=1 Tax=Harmonia axyridis TaxID=115357 RepID=UPI001E279370|nr:cytoglobin-2-like [Harmonia axyridis]